MAVNTFNEDITKVGGSVVPTGGQTPISVSDIITPQTPVVVPPTPAINTGATANTAIPTPQDIANASNATTTTDTAQSTLLQRIADITGSGKSLDTYKIEQEKAAGLSALNDTKNTLYDQLTGYNDSILKLQVDASPGGTIENTLQEGVLGRGITTTGGIAPLRAGELRKNQIEQASIATKALVTKAAYLAADRQYTSAKEAADSAAQVAFDAQEQEVKYANALLAALAPQLTKEENTRAAVLTTQLNERTTQIANQREDFKTGQALAITAMQNNPDDPTAQFAAQQAFAIDPKDPQYISKIMNLVGRYQQDPAAIEAAIIDRQYKLAQIAKLKKETEAAEVPTITNPEAGKYTTALNTILGSTKLTKEQKATLVNSVNTGEDPFTVIKNQAKDIMGQTNATKLDNFETAKAQIESLDSLLKQYYANGGKTNLFSGNYTKVLNKIGEVNDPELVAITTQISSALQIYRNAVSGTAYSEQEGRDIASIFPGINKTEGLNQAIIKGRLNAFNDTIDASYRNTLGATYDTIKSGLKSGKSDAQFINDSLKNAGLNYDDVLGQVPAGEIAVVDNLTGKIGTIPLGEFTSTKYTKL